jgi:radical SAM superfamily enzyme YgiQ (UPF0313 family)
MTPPLILVNPWIYDFAAYDLWSKPLGLLYLAGYLRHCGFPVHLVDCLSVHHPAMKGRSSVKPAVRRAYGTGKYFSQRVDKPATLAGVPRPYSRYGLLPEIVSQELKKIRNPAAILVTSLMTYWYPGVRETIRLAKDVHPGVPVILGGIYATLCPGHAARETGADATVTDRGPQALLTLLEEWGISAPEPPSEGVELPYPAFDLLSDIDYVCLLTSVGCPYGCRYCASRFLNPVPSHRSPGEVLEEIRFWKTHYHVRDFAFYDDALLVGAETHFSVLLEEIARLDLDLRFHTPNALHVKEITADIARLMHLTGFRTIRLGLETSDLSALRQLGPKLGEGDFQQAVSHLHRAGFSPAEIGAYIMIGLPGQSVDSVISTIDFVGSTGAIPFLSEYSPIPHTSLWAEAVRQSEYDLSSEPLFQNNILIPCWTAENRQELPRLKRRVLEIRETYRTS